MPYRETFADWKPGWLPGPNSLWRPVATCGGLWRPVAGDGLPLKESIEIFENPRPELSTRTRSTPGRVGGFTYFFDFFVFFNIFLNIF